MRIRTPSNRQRTTDNGQGKGFTLVELLVVITIILLVSAVALPVVLPALAHAQMSEAARALQGALAGARDSAIHNQLPSGIRLLPDPTLNGINPATGLLDANYPLAFNRIVPIESPPPYSEGMVAVLPAGSITLPFPCIAIQEWAVDLTTGLPNSPTSWFWNIRVGDKIQINNAGPFYTVVGPMAIGPNDTLTSNTEMFVNVGPPGTTSPVTSSQNGVTVNPEFLYLVNGEDDNGNGWIDEGFDGVNNNYDQETALGLPHLTDELAEWEAEHLKGSAAIPGGFPNNVPYTILRRPAPAANAREQGLPTNVVVDATTWGGTQERSRLPVNPYTGTVDILIYPGGQVVPTTIYSTPASFGMGGAFLHFWLAERSDVVAMNLSTTGTPVSLSTTQTFYLPVGTIQQQLTGTTYTGPTLQGQYNIVTLFSRNGQVTTNATVQFDNPSNPYNGTTYNPGFPFLPAEQGSRGGP
jgi:prepilin-type N-terminal cleavage/methylation domain-containing protein